jgi:hypothetical protein
MLEMQTRGRKALDMAAHTREFCELLERMGKKDAVLYLAPVATPMEIAYRQGKTLKWYIGRVARVTSAGVVFTMDDGDEDTYTIPDLKKMWADGELRLLTRR